MKFEVVEYLKTPLNHKILSTLFDMLGIHPNQAIRKNESEFSDNNIKEILSDKDKLIDAIIKFPKILERPIIVINKKATIGRPPENIYDII